MAALASVVLTLAIANRGSNCGGNSAALSDVHLFVLIVQGVQERRPGHRFDLDSATTEERRVLASIVDDAWISPAAFPVTPRPAIRPSGPRRLLIVCDRPSRNVPRRLFGLAPSTHAAGFSDGSVEPITVADFAALDRAASVPLERFLAGTEGVSRQTPMERVGE